MKEDIIIENSQNSNGQKISDNFLNDNEPRNNIRSNDDSLQDINNINIMGGLDDQNNLNDFEEFDADYEIDFEPKDGIMFQEYKFYGFEEAIKDAERKRLEEEEENNEEIEEDEEFNDRIPYVKIHEFQDKENYKKGFMFQFGLGVQQAFQQPVQNTIDKMNGIEKEADKEKVSNVAYRYYDIKDNETEHIFNNKNFDSADYELKVTDNMVLLTVADENHSNGFNVISEINKDLGETYGKYLNDIEKKYDKDIREFQEKYISLLDEKKGNLFRAFLENPTLCILDATKNDNLKDDETHPFAESKKAFNVDEGSGNIYFHFMRVKKTFGIFAELELRKQKLVDGEKTKDTVEAYKKDYKTAIDNFLKSMDVLRSIKDDEAYNPYMDNKIDIFVGRTDRAQRDLCIVEGYCEGVKAALDNGWDISETVVLGTIGSIISQAKALIRKYDYKVHSNITLAEYEQNAHKKLKVFLTEAEKLKKFAFGKKIQNYNDKKKVINSLILFTNQYTKGKTWGDSKYSTSDIKIQHCLSFVQHAKSQIIQIQDKINKKKEKERKIELEKKVFKDFLKNRDPDNFRVMAAWNGWPIDNIPFKDMRSDPFLRKMGLLQDAINNGIKIGEISNDDWRKKYNKFCNRVQGAKLRGYNDYCNRLKDFEKLCDEKVPEDVSSMPEFQEFRSELAKQKTLVLTDAQKRRMEGINGQYYNTLGTIINNLTDARNSYIWHDNTAKFNNMVNSIKKLYELGPENKISPVKFENYQNCRRDVYEKCVEYLNSVGHNTAWHKAGTRRRNAALLAICIAFPVSGEDAIKIINNARKEKNHVNFDLLMATEGVGVKFPGDFQPDERNIRNEEAKKRAETAKKRTEVTRKSTGSTIKTGL